MASGQSGPWPETSQNEYAHEMGGRTSKVDVQSTFQLTGINSEILLTKIGMAGNVQFQII
jgi:hypothetical protein